MRCSVCGADNLEGAVYCEDCGARLPGAGAAAPTPVVAAPPPVAPPPPPPPPPTPAAEPDPAAAPAAGGPTACAACGANNLPNVAFCEDCGASLSAGGVNPVSSQPPVTYDAPTPVAPTPQPDAGRRARLLHSSGKEFPLDKDVILIGRRSPVDGIFPEVDLTDYDTESYISRRHAKLMLNESGILFEDLGSSNGSFLNGSRMQSGVQQMVRDGDSLRLGKTELVLRCS